MLHKYLIAMTVGYGLFFGLSFARAAEPLKSLPLVYDAQTKAHFIGANSKFVLKPGEQSPIIDRIEVALDNGEYVPYGQAIDFKSEGKHTLKFRAITPVNNWSPVQFVEVFVDLTPPTTQVKFSEESSFKDDKNLFLGLNTTISLAAQDNLSGVAAVEYSWDGNKYFPYTRPLVLDKVGKQTLYYRSVDRVENWEEAKHIAFTVDGTPPTSKITLDGPTKPVVVGDRTYVSDSLGFKVTAEDDSSKVKQTWIIVDGKPHQYVEPIHFIKEGPHTLEYYSVDNVGNTEAKKKISVYTVSTPPRTTLATEGKSVNTGGVNYATQNFRIFLKAKDNVVGLDHIEVKADEEKEFKPYFEAVGFNTPGLHHITYRAVDRAGNFEPAKTFNVFIVSIMPETMMNTAQSLIERDGVTYSPSPNVVTLNVANNSGVGIRDTMISINDGPWAPYRGPITLNDESKTYKISYKSIDKLGNEEQTKTANFHMVRSLPTVDLFVTQGRSSEEQIRTNFLEQPPDRAPASATEPSPEAAPPSAHATDLPENAIAPDAIVKEAPGSER